MSTETEFLQRQTLTGLRSTLEDTLNDLVPMQFKGSPDARANFRHEVLRWCLRDSEAGHVHWQALESSGSLSQELGREDYVLELWSRLTSRDGNPEWRNLIENRLGNWEIYQDFLFAWLLGRFNLSAARSLASGRRPEPGEHLPYVEFLGLAFAMAASLALWITAHERLSAFTAGAGLVAAALVFGFGRWTAGVGPRPFVHLLLPRLAATVGIGYLALAAATDLMGMIYKTGSGVFPYLLSMFLLAGCLGFTMLHVDRRVAPSLSAAKLCGRSLTVLALGIGHATTGLALFSPLLFHPSFLDLPSVHPCPGQLILTAAVALSLGVALQLVWEEKSLTQPL